MPTNGRLRFALYLIVGKDSLVKWKPWKYSKHFQMLFWKPEVKQLFHQIKIGFWTWILRVAARRAQLRGPTNKTLLSWFANTRKPSLMHFACPNLFMVIIIKTYLQLFLCFYLPSCFSDRQAFNYIYDLVKLGKIFGALLYVQVGHSRCISIFLPSVNEKRMAQP